MAKVYLIWEADGETLELNCVSLDEDRVKNREADY